MRSTDTFDLKQSAADATVVRREIARLFGAKPAARIVLAPGMLSGLRHLFSALQIDRLVITTQEYYAPAHFPTLKVEAVAPSVLVARVVATNPGAVVASVVSWQGTSLPVSDLFGEIRRACGARRPLLVADYTHAGAIGFPTASTLNADVVGGDPEKWLLPARRRSGLAYLSIPSATLFRRAARAFSPFFLAVDGRSDTRSARWLDPEEIREMADWLSSARLTRRRLRDRHQANLRLKHRLARSIGIVPGGDAAMLWTNAKIPASLQSRLSRLGLLWRAPDGYARILCRDERHERDNL